MVPLSQGIQVSELQPSRRWATCLPPSRWFSGYNAGVLRSDALAGVTLAAYAIPVSMAYTTLAGLPPHFGIYCYLLGGLFYAFLGTSRQLAVGPTSAIALLVGTTIAGMAEGDPARWAAIASLTALTVAVISALAWLFRLSSLMSFISETILLGFKAGAALTIALTQLPKLFGVKGGGDHFFERVWILLGQLGQTNFVVLAFGLTALALLLLGDKLLPSRPIALMVVALATAVVSFTSLESAGVSTVGALPAGLPTFNQPDIRWRDVDGILPLSFACFLLSYIESVSAARTLAAKNGYEIDARQELLALGAANLAVGLSQGMPVAGGLSQSAVNDKAGARTPVALICTSITLAICLLFLTDLLSNLPTVVLASIVLVAVRGLIDLKGLRHLRKVSRLEFNIAMVALIGVLLLGILKGVLIAAIASLILLLSRAAHPHVAFLGRIPGTRRYSDMERHPDNEALPGILIFRVESSLLYFNVDHVRKVVWSKLQADAMPRLVIADMSDVPFVDLAGARLLKSLHQDLASRGIQFRIAEAHANVRDLLRAEGMEERVGYMGRRMSVEQAITEFEQKAAAESPSKAQVTT